MTICISINIQCAIDIAKASYYALSIICVLWSIGYTFREIDGPGATQKAGQPVQLYVQLLHHPFHHRCTNNREQNRGYKASSKIILPLKWCFWLRCNPSSRRETYIRLPLFLSLPSSFVNIACVKSHSSCFHYVRWQCGLGTVVFGVQYVQFIVLYDGSLID